jgi:hypothetical protein
MDKLKHFIVSAGIVIVAGYFSLLWLGVIVALFVGFYKEFFIDKKPDWFDILANMGGILSGVVIWLIT